MKAAQTTGVEPTWSSAMKAAQTAAMKAAKTAAVETTAPTAVEATATSAMRGVGEIRRRERRDAQQGGREKSRCPADAGPSASGLRGNRNLADIDPFHEDLLRCVGRPTGRPRRQAEVGRWR
jgi:hypothetical protein